MKKLLENYMKNIVTLFIETKKNNIEVIVMKTSTRNKCFDANGASREIADR